MAILIIKNLLILKQNFLGNLRKNFGDLGKTKLMYVLMRKENFLKSTKKSEEAFFNHDNKLIVCIDITEKTIY